MIGAVTENGKLIIYKESGKYNFMYNQYLSNKSIINH